MLKKLLNFLIGLFSVFIFYDTAGIIAGYIISDAIANQTHNSATLFDSWWQILIFVLDFVFAICLALCVYFRIREGKKEKYEKATI